MGVHIVDTNFFIEAHRKTYPLDVAPSFWNKIKELADQGHIISIDKVKTEIYSNNDPLKDWCIANLPRGFFVDTSIVVSEWTTVTQWAQARPTPPFMHAALAEFLSATEADAWLVAYAYNSTADRRIVTHETSAPLATSRVKIPDACLAHGVSFCNTIDMFRNLGASF